MTNLAFQPETVPVVSVAVQQVIGAAVGLSRLRGDTVPRNHGPPKRQYFLSVVTELIRTRIRIHLTSFRDSLRIDTRQIERWVVDRAWVSLTIFLSLLFSETLTAQYVSAIQPLFDV
jgi:hypothetical protein